MSGNGRLGLGFALLLSAGCAATSDIVWLASKPRQSDREQYPEVPTYRGAPADSRRYLDVDGQGALVCIDELHRVDRRPTVTTVQRTRNGLIPGAYGLAVLVDAIVTFPALYGTAYLAAPITCPNRECETRGQRAALAAGAITLLDMMWGTYRALTVNRTILEQAALSYRDEPRVVAAPCAVGTLITLQGEAGTLELRFEAGGRLDDELVPALQAFMASETRVSVLGDTRVTVQVPKLHDLVQRLVPRVGENVVLPRIQIDWTFTGPRVSAELDVPLGSLCYDEAMCRPGQRCGDRGDGIYLCMGSNQPGHYCQLDGDCASGSCNLGPNGLRICSSAAARPRSP